MELLPGIHPPPRMISPWFVDHRSGKPRLVVDLRMTNELILDPTYVAYEDLGFVPDLIQPGDVIWSLDIRSAYYGVSLHPEFIPYCCIYLNGRVLAATVMLLGLSVAPRIYTALTEVVIQILRSFGIRIIRYLDDFLGASRTHLAHLQIKLTIVVLTLYGFYVSFKKSQLIPCLVLRHLGLIIDADQRAFRIPLQKVVDIRNFCFAAVAKGSLRLVSLQRLVGKIISVKRALRPARRLTWSLFWDMMNSSAVNPSDRIMLSVQSISDLRYLFDSLSEKTEAPFDPPDHLMLIFSDSAGKSGRGWGGHVPGMGMTAHGVWPESLVETDIQILELMATILVILVIRPQNVSLCLLSDNSSSVQYIHRQGGCRHQLMMRLTFLLYAITEQLNCPIVQSIWIPSQVNLVADHLSRGRLLSTAETERQWRHTADILGIGYNGWINKAELETLRVL
ncbi:MAG: reverse transcriptase domain-containing protein [Candidatus Paceibacterota bacterium]